MIHHYSQELHGVTISPLLEERNVNSGRSVWALIDVSLLHLFPIDL